MNIYRRFCLLFFLLCLISGVRAENPTSKEQLLEQRGKLELSMAKVRLKLLHENEELRDLNLRIIKLQKLLSKKLNSQPEIQFLLNKQDDINQKLEVLD